MSKDRDKNGSPPETTPQQRDLMDLVRGNGPWQWMICAVVLAINFPDGANNMAMVFMAPNVDHWCARPPQYNGSAYEWKETALPHSDVKCSRTLHRPPEALRDLKAGESMDGQNLDLWSFGASALELFTDFSVFNSYRYFHLGITEGQASMREALQAETFAEKIKNALPAVELRSEDIESALNFVHSFLKRDPKDRMRADLGLKHKFLGKGDLLTSDLDSPWKPQDTVSEGFDVTTYSGSKIGHTKKKRRFGKWLRRHWSNMRTMFARFIPCVK